MPAFRPRAVIRDRSHPRERGPCSPLTRPPTLLAYWLAVIRARHDADQVIDYISKKLTNMSVLTYDSDLWPARASPLRG